MLSNTTLVLRLPFTGPFVGAVTDLRQLATPDKIVEQAFAAPLFQIEKPHRLAHCQCEAGESVELATQTADQFLPRTIVPPLTLDRGVHGVGVFHDAVPVSRSCYLDEWACGRE